jgi:hypothetical protein
VRKWNLYPSTDVIRRFKSGRMKRLEHTEHKGDIKNADKIIAGSPEEKRLLWGPMEPTSSFS